MQSAPAAGLARWGLLALVSAALYGASFPLSKRLVGEVAPFMLGGLFYVFTGIVLFLVRAVKPAAEHSRIRGRDWAWLMGAAAFGGAAGPALYLFGQREIPSYVGAILAPSEIMFTTAIAVMFFRERLEAKDWIAIGLLIAGGVLVGLKLEDEPGGGNAPLGAMLVLASFLMWGIDNNCTNRVAIKDPLQIAMIKGLVGGAVNLGLAVASGDAFPEGGAMLAQVAAVGAICFGGSYVLLIYSMRGLGASRAIAMFGTNPAFGVLLGRILIPKEQLHAWMLVGGALLLAGAMLLLRRSQASS